MNFSEWNELLGESFLRGHPNQPVYFAVTPTELSRLNENLELGLDDPLTDLRDAIRLYSFLSFDTMHSRWERSKATELPPWLPFLAASTIVVDQQTEEGSLRFYEPLAEFLGFKKRITQQDYESTFHRWWASLARWLTDEKLLDGACGFATWTSIPTTGPRCIIGHPYTQVLLRPEERRQIDDFLSEFERAGDESAVARDRDAVAAHLVQALRRSARNGGVISARLRRILENGSKVELELLGFLLLGRLFNDEPRGERTDRTQSAIRLVPAYDEYQRSLQILALAPTWVNASNPVAIVGADQKLEQPDDVVSVDLTVTDKILSEGVVLGTDPEVRLAGRQHFLMAARQWDLWCTVDTAQPDEDIVLLIKTDQACRHQLQAVKNVQGLPPEWVICGPLPARQLPQSLSDGVAVSGRQLLPQLVGGLKLQSRLYLKGGEPVLELADYQGPISIDGREVETDGTTIALRKLDLPPGGHQIRVGGFDLDFATDHSVSALEPKPELGRNAIGQVVPIDSDERLFTGVLEHQTAVRSNHRGLIPHTGPFFKLGDPGELAEIGRPTMAAWAQDAGLVRLVTEVYARSTHPFGKRVISQPRWIVWQEKDCWVIHELRAPEADPNAPVDPLAWRDLCDRIGNSPRVWPDSDADVVTRRWREYCSRLGEH